jgi:hypothetical protein
MSLVEEKNLTVIRKGGELPVLPYQKIKNTILGKDFDLTLIFCTPKESQERNKAYRGKTTLPTFFHSPHQIPRAKSTYAFRLHGAMPKNSQCRTRSFFIFFLFMDASTSKVMSTVITWSTSKIRL